MRLISKLHLVVALAMLAGSPETTAQTRQFDRLMESLLGKYDIAGGSLSVSFSGRLIYSKGFGLADKQKRTPVSPKSLFRISSVSKPFTAAAIMKLVEQRKLRLDTPVYSIIGRLPIPPGHRINPRIKQITVQDLLRHSSGQEIYNAQGRITSPMQPPVSRKVSRLFAAKHPPSFEQVAGFMQTQPLMHPPGTQFKYSNYGYALLGLIIERISGKSYEKFVQDELLKPIGIVSMQLGGTLESNARPDEVTYYDLPGRALVRSVLEEHPPGPFPYAGRHIQGWGGAGAWIASSRDVVRFMNHIDGMRQPGVLDKRSMARMVEQQYFPKNRKGFWYGLGLRVQQKSDGVHAWHNGASNSGAAALMMRTNTGIVWAAMFNQRLPAGRSLYKEFTREMFRIVRQTKQWPRGDLFAVR
ncbi:MAG: serine hydrolase domain-containing protein [Burkholderiaceae bacterium]